MLEGVVENGTAKNLKNSTYAIAGKTGTAQIARGSGGYAYQGAKSYQASFVGYFPADNPKYSCMYFTSVRSLYAKAYPTFRVLSTAWNRWLR